MQGKDHAIKEQPKRLLVRSFASEAACTLKFVLQYFFVKEPVK